MCIGTFDLEFTVSKHDIQLLPHFVPFKMIKQLTPTLLNEFSQNIKKDDNRVVLLTRIGWLNFSDQF